MPEHNANFLVDERLCELLLDDLAGGHGGWGPDLFLKTLGAQRIRVPGRATSLVQPADRLPNQVWKRILANLMDDWSVRQSLEEQFKKQVGTSLTVEVRPVFSLVFPRP